MNLNMMNHEKNGILITFCGLDGCGKTTMMEMLKNKLNNLGIEVFLTKQPTNFVRNNPMFRTYMDEENHNEFDYRALSLLAASDRIQHSNKYILPLLDKGDIVISDRYFYSCLANLRARGFTKDKWIYDVSQYIPKPDIAFFLDVDVETAISRIRKRKDEKNKWIDIDLQYKLRNEYASICKINKGILIDTSQSERCAFDKVWFQVEPLLDKYDFNF